MNNICRHLCRSAGVSFCAYRLAIVGKMLYNVSRIMMS